MYQEITHNRQRIVVLDEGYRIASFCEPNDIFVTYTDNVFHVGDWDGEREWPISGPYGTELEAIEAAKKSCAAYRTYPYRYRPKILRTADQDFC